MNVSDLTPTVLRELITLAEKKQSLIEQITKIDQSITSLSSGTDLPTKQAPKVSTPKKAKKSEGTLPPIKIAKRSKLKEGVLALLTSAGPDGVKVVDIAKSLGVKSTSVHVWFNTTGKKVTGITRVAPGKYSLQPPAA